MFSAWNQKTKQPNMPSQSVYSLPFIEVALWLKLAKIGYTNFGVHELCEISVDFDENATDGLHLNQIMGKCLDPLISRHRPHFEIL